MGTAFSPFQFARLPYWVIPTPTGFPATKAKNISFPVWASTGASHGPRLHDLALLLTVPTILGNPNRSPLIAGADPDCAGQALSRCDEGSIKVSRWIVGEQFADFQNPSLEAAIASVF
jgi:hypothetical protein